MNLLPRNIDVDSNFFVENNFKRYLIFGTNPQNSDYLKNNSIYGIQSENGFFMFHFYLKNQLQMLATQGIYIIEDFKLDFHSSNNEIIDASRIGEITGSSICKTKLQCIQEMEL